LHFFLTKRTAAAIIFFGEWFPGNLSDNIALYKIVQRFCQAIMRRLGVDAPVSAPSSPAAIQNPIGSMRLRRWGRVYVKKPYNLQTTGKAVKEELDRETSSEWSLGSISRLD
jgi:hypothetical protein